MAKRDETKDEHLLEKIHEALTTLRLPVTRKTLDDLLALCKEQDSKLVLAVDQSLSKDFQRVALGFCGDHKIPFVTGFAINKGHYPVEALVEQVLSALIR